MIDYKSILEKVLRSRYCGYYGKGGKQVSCCPESDCNEARLLLRELFGEKVVLDGWAMTPEKIKHLMEQYGIKNDQ